LIKEQEVK